MLFNSCNHNQAKTKKHKQPDISNLAPVKYEYQQDLAPEDSIPDLLSCETAMIQGLNYKVCSEYSKGIYALNPKKDTVFKLPYPCSAEFKDFNKDGYKDIYIDYITNVPDIHDLALYDTLPKTFILVNDLTKFPAPKQISGTHYYYSYHRSGCADMNWGSDLFYIEGNKTYLIGMIEGKGCESEANQGVFIYKSHDGKERLIRSFLISVIEKYNRHKWGFIEDYWKKNYRLFIEPTSLDK